MANRIGGVFITSLLIVFSACSLDKSGSSTMPSASVSAYALSPGAASLNLFLNSSNVAANIPFGSFTLYNQVTPGDVTLKAQTPSQNLLTEATFNTQAGDYYSAFLIRSDSTHMKAIIANDAISASSDSVYFRFFNFSPDAPAVDVYSYSDSTNHTTIWKNRSYDSLPLTDAEQTFVPAKPGTYNFYILRSGTTDTLARFAGQNLTANGYYTLLLENYFKSPSTGDTTLQFGIRRH